MNCGWYSAPSAASCCVIDAPGATLAPGIVVQADTAAAAQPARAICFIMSVGLLGIARSSTCLAGEPPSPPVRNRNRQAVALLPQQPMPTGPGRVARANPLLAPSPECSGR